MFAPLLFFRPCVIFYPALRLTAPVCLLGKVNLMISPTPGQITNWTKKVCTVASSWLQKHATVLCFLFFISIPCWVPQGLMDNVVICPLLALSNFYNFLKECHCQKGQCGRTVHKMNRRLFTLIVHQCGASVTALVTRIMTANSLFGFPRIWGIPLFWDLFVEVSVLRCHIWILWQCCIEIHENYTGHNVTQGDI